MSNFSLIYITIPNKKEAKRISQILIEKRLAACVNFFPTESIFRWKGKVQREREWAMIVKTKTNLVEKIIKEVKKIHPYEVPCIISIPIEKGYQKFLKWIEGETNKEHKIKRKNSHYHLNNFFKSELCNI